MLHVPELVVLGLAAYRGTQLAVHDSILDPLRDRLFAWHAAAANSAARTFWITLISCTYCTGWWISGAVLATWLFATGAWTGVPVLVHGLEWFAVAGAQALLNRWDDSRKETS